MRSPLARRTLLRAVLSASVAAGMPAKARTERRKGKPMTPPEPEYASLPIVDAHHHLWDLSKFRLPWLGGSSPIARSFVMDDYLKATSGLNVVKTVYMEVGVEEKQQVEEAEYVIDLCGRDDNPMVAAVIGGNPAAPGFRDYISRYRGSPYVKGVRRGLPERRPDGSPAPEFVRGVQLLGELGMSFDLLLGPERLPDAIRLVDACPHTRFILDHCGNPGVLTPDRGAWEKDVTELARRKHVICKVSGIVASAKEGAWKPADLEPIVTHVLHAFGPDRVVFGGDWPVCTLRATYRQWVDALRWIVRDRPHSEQRQLFHDNAARFYGLK